MSSMCLNVTEFHERLRCDIVELTSTYNFESLSDAAHIYSQLKKLSKTEPVKKKCKKVSSNPQIAFYKSDLCKQFMEKGVCSFEDKCQYAHGKHQLVKRHCTKQKTKQCDSYQKQGCCRYGQRCNYRHENNEHKGRFNLQTTIQNFAIPLSDIDN